MTKAELAAITVWDENKLGNLSLFIPLFNDAIKIVLFPDLDQPVEVTDKMAAIVNDLLQLKQDQLGRVKDLLWEECLFAFHVADYGVEQMEGESHVEAHLREFEISNAEDAFSKSTIREIHVSDEFKNRYAEIKVETGSNNYISLIVKNGQIIDFGDDGVHLGWFEEDALYLHKKRQKILAE
ncbi:MAG: hypothetical protein ACJ751_19075 [Niastella sp.]|uniref:hypothetical protein n=1 Tax=Niastella sp. TaxID=1869183 RepID=UPI003899A71F